MHEFERQVQKHDRNPLKIIKAIIYAPFSSPTIQKEEPIDMEKSMKDLIQKENSFTQSINSLEALISHLINTMNDRNEKTLPTQFLTILDFPSHIDRNHES